MRPLWKLPSTDDWWLSVLNVPVPLSWRGLILLLPTPLPVFMWLSDIVASESFLGVCSWGNPNDWTLILETTGPEDAWFLLQYKLAEGPQVGHNQLQRSDCFRLCSQEKTWAQSSGVQGGLCRTEDATGLLWGLKEIKMCIKFRWFIHTQQTFTKCQLRTRLSADPARVQRWVSHFLYPVEIHAVSWRVREKSFEHHTACKRSAAAKGVWKELPGARSLLSAGGFSVPVELPVGP